MMGISPFGSLVMGSLSSRYGIFSVTCIFGVICAINALFFLRKANNININLREIYYEKNK
jgi:hypothetical protein